MASLEGFVLWFCALDYTDYARWFPIHIRHENTLTRIQKIISALLGAACLSRTINCNACDRAEKTIVTLWPYLAIFSVFLTIIIIVFLRWLVKYKQEAQGPWRLSTALQKISYKCVRECISILYDALSWKDVYPLYRSLAFILLCSVPIIHFADFTHVLKHCT